jgi:YtcA family
MAKLALSGADEVVDGITIIFDTHEGLLEMNIESTERDRRRTTSLRRLAGLFLAVPPVLVLVGCSHAPEYSIFGSFFPVWIFCSVGGLLLTTGARALIARTTVAEYLAAPVLLYLSMAVFFACMLWLLFYS